MACAPAFHILRHCLFDFGQLVQRQEVLGNNALIRSDLDRGPVHQIEIVLNQPLPVLFRVIQVCRIVLWLLRFFRKHRLWMRLTICYVDVANELDVAVQSWRDARLDILLLVVFLSVLHGLVVGHGPEWKLLLQLLMQPNGYWLLVLLHYLLRIVVNGDAFVELERQENGVSDLVTDVRRWKVIHQPNYIRSDLLFIHLLLHIHMRAAPGMQFAWPDVQVLFDGLQVEWLDDRVVLFGGGLFGQFAGVYVQRRWYLTEQHSRQLGLVLLLLIRVLFVGLLRQIGRSGCGCERRLRLVDGTHVDGND